VILVNRFASSYRQRAMALVSFGLYSFRPASSLPVHAPPIVLTYR
jgi:hypothetical protein